MAEVIQSIFIQNTEVRSTPKPHTVYQIEVHAAVRTWIVWKRYSEFEKLHNQFKKIFPSNPPPVNLPGKRIFPSTFSSPEKVDERRRGLEDYLRSILSNRDDRWRQTDAWKEFLAIPVGRSLDTSIMYTSESWLDEYNDMSNIAREVRSLTNRRSTHIARNEISASHNCTVQAKKLLLSLSSKLSNLDAGLGSLALADGESRRRQDMLNSLRDEKDALHRLVNSGRQDQELVKHQQPRRSNTVHSEKATLLTNGDHTLPTNNKQPPRRNNTIGPGRAFGAAAVAAAAAKETEITRGLDNEGLLQYQQEVMNDQDMQVEQFSALLARQKQLGLAIGDELEVQNQILDELDADVDRTGTKLKFANKKLATIK
ncbi:Phox homologous domain-containing protein [Dichotomocladium elegans]|nr:Phox homologous domain-containing protein [Dichotomocladium elegans]